VFTRAMTGLASYRGEVSFRSWLFAIAHNTIVDARRAKRPVYPIDAAEEMPDPGDSPEEMALARETKREITALLAQLEPAHRELLELRLAGLTDAEIARVVGRSHGAVRTAQYRSIAKLRALWATAAGEDEGRVVR
jgi:RNA polymerase sigma-70 factor (ECF subfamily)